MGWPIDGGGAGFCLSRPLDDDKRLASIRRLLNDTDGDPLDGLGMHQAHAARWVRAACADRLAIRQSSPDARAEASLRR